MRHTSLDVPGHRCLCGPVIREGRSFVSNDLASEADLPSWWPAMERAGIRAAAVIPIRVRDEVWGVLGIYEAEMASFQDQEIALLEEAAVDIGYAIENLDNEAQRRQAEKFQRLSTAILGVLNEPLGLQEATGAILGLIKEEIGVDAVGIRLKDHDDFPFFSSDGLDDAFLRAESSVVLRDESGVVCRDENGDLRLECTCGMVLAEKCGPPSDHVTQYGSFWTNDGPALAASLEGDDPRVRPRDRCSHDGLNSLALIPIRAENQVLGLLHLGDRRKDVFTPDAIRFFERLTASFGVAVKRRQDAAALRESEARFRSLIEGAPEAVFVQCDGIFTYVNQAMVRLVGAAWPKDLLGRPYLERVSAAYHELVSARVREQHDSSMVVPPMEQVYLRLDGTEVPVETTAVAVRFEGQDGRLVFVRDITARQEAEKERADLETQLWQAQKMESIGRLAGGVAHDFNNLLTGIMGYADMCRSAVPADHPIAPWLDEITGGAQRSAGITRQLLAFARQQTISPVVLDLNDHVAGTLELMRPLIGEDVELIWRPEAQEAAVKMDPSQIDQILANLVVNARDAIAGVGTLTIETSQALVDAEYCSERPGAVPGSYVVLAVSDSGCGMDRATLDRIFEPFFTTKEPGKGTGLGLATVYGIVQQNGGFVDVQSRPRKGTTFRVYIPGMTGRASEAETPATSSQAAEGSETVLLVEDDRSVRAITERFLKSLGYTVVVAADPEQAMRLADEYPGPIHLLITDVVMPGMNGRDLASTLAVKSPDMRCLFMSGYTSDVIAHQGVLEDGVQFLGKPFTRNDLAQAVRDALQGRPNP